MRRRRRAYAGRRRSYGRRSYARRPRVRRMRRGVTLRRRLGIRR